jgi:hypothetical protein
MVGCSIFLWGAFHSDTVEQDRAELMLLFLLEYTLSIVPLLHLGSVASRHES